MGTYLFEDNDGNVRETPNGDHWARGRCSGIPDCCIQRFVDAGFPMEWESWEPEDWGYRPCKACVDSGNRVTVRMCADLKDACTCGAWANSKIVELEPFDACPKCGGEIEEIDGYLFCVARGVCTWCAEIE
jgi:hypothetical protein